MKCFYAANLVTQSVTEGLPWDFKPTEQITAQIRGDKEERQHWYSNPATAHCFYTFIEGLNSNLRVSKENNPPFAIYGLPADYDTLGLSKERIMEAVEKMRVKPTYIEQSLGGNWRLVWVFPRPIYLASYAFTRLFLEKAVRLLDLHTLPCFDEQSFITPTRLFCNGCSWEKVGEAFPEDKLQAFYFECAREFNKFSSSTTDNDVPLDLIEKAIRVKYPHFDWPSKFEENSQGPSFWIPESTSPMSAIVKRNGMVTFSAHATKGFYTWADILGAEFSREWSEEAIAKATKDVYWDRKGAWIKGRNGLYTCQDRTVLQNYLKVNCDLSAQEDKQTRKSQIDLAMNHIYFENEISGAGPFVFVKPGIIHYQGEKRLNTYSCKPIEPATGEQKFGPHGNCPWLSALTKHLFAFESEFPYWHLLAWFQYYYNCAINWAPQPGQNIFIGGIPGIGKTFFNREVIGAAVGGCIDASDFFLDKSDFNAHLFHIPHWVLDDDTPSGSAGAIMKTSSLLKKIASNTDAVSNAKYQQQCRVRWAGRAGITFNLDSYSGRIVGPVDEGTREKMNIYRCNTVPFPFPSRPEQMALTTKEISFWLRALIDAKIPDFIIRDNRYGIKDYQDPMILDHAHQSQSIAPFKEVLIEALMSYFTLNPNAPVWKGTVSQMVRMLAADLNNTEILRTLKLDQANRYLEQIQKEGLIKFEFESGKLKTRICIIPRSSIMPETPIVPASGGGGNFQLTEGVANPFQK